MSVRDVKSKGGQFFQTSPFREIQIAAHDLLDCFEETQESFLDKHVIPIKRLVRGLNESLSGIPSLLSEKDGTMSGAGLFKRCKVRLPGIPERQFIIHDIYWDYGEVRVREIGTRVEYVLPWDCLRICHEHGE